MSPSPSSEEPPKPPRPQQLTVRWEHFRSLTDTGDLEFRPLTILLGANNAGKTSVMAPLLLLKQSLESETGESALLLTGPTLDLGTFSDVVQAHDPNGSFTFTLKWAPARQNAEVKPPPYHRPGALSLRFINGERPHEVRLDRFQVKDIHGQRLLLRSLSKTGKYTLRLATAQDGSWPDLNDASRKAARQARIEIKDARPLDFLFKSEVALRVAFSQTEQGDGEAIGPLFDPDVRWYFTITGYVEQEIANICRAMHYVGPLREPPRRIYELGGEMPREVGRRGENTPEILFRWREDDAKISKVHGWLSTFGYDERLTWMEYGDTAFGMFVRRAPETAPTSFLDLGFGMSQILPLIVQGLAATPGDRILIEQPEIHLNPRLQAKVGDLLKGIVDSGVGVVVETHSEHLLLRIRRLIAERKLDTEDVALYYIDRSGDSSVVRRIAITESGYIAPEDWPANFFDDGLRESLGLATAQARLNPRA
jgi:hypothetical protein